MKRSRAIGLVVLGTAGLLAGCNGTEERTQQLTQNHYASQQDCERDWQDPEVCQRTTSGGGGYVGPRYYWSHSGGTPIAIMPDGSERPMTRSALAMGKPSVAKSSVSSTRSVSISRGGFGGTAHASSAGG